MNFQSFTASRVLFDLQAKVPPSCSVFLVEGVCVVCVSVCAGARVHVRRQSDAASVNKPLQISDWTEDV